MAIKDGQHSGGSGVPASGDAQRYARLLAEAQEIRGISLWQDAWRRLRKNRAATVALVFLCVVSLLAVATPLLPLQSPLDKDLANRELLVPEWTSSVPLGARAELKFKDGSLVRQLERYDEQLRLLKQNLKQDVPAKRMTIREQIERKYNEHPFRKLWHRPGMITCGLIRVRLAVFGDRCIPSICGTDTLGRDVLARIFWGARVSLVVGIVATFVSLMIGVSYGAIAGYLGGSIDNLMMRLVDVLYSIPFIFVVIFLITILSEDRIKARLDSWHINRIMIFYIVIGAIYWLTMARVVRGQVISLKNEQFVEAARTIGASRMRIVFRHLVPNVLGVVIVYLTLTIPSVMLFEAFLSFLGLGVEPPDVSWGLLANDGIEVITPVRTYWWLILYPGSALALTLFALNFFGDGLRDALDPRMKNR